MEFWIVRIFDIFVVGETPDVFGFCFFFGVVFGFLVVVVVVVVVLKMSALIIMMKTEPNFNAVQCLIQHLKKYYDVGQMV